MGFSLFKRKQSTANSMNEAYSSEPLTVKQAERIYERPDSFVDKLPYYEYVPESECMLLDDGRSVGAVLDVTPVATEGRSYEWLQDKRDQIQDAIQDALPEEGDAPWIVQMYAYDLDDMSATIERLREYAVPHARDTEFTAAWLNVYAHHLNGIARPEGIFEDKTVLEGPWGGKYRMVKMVIYRRLPKNFQSFKDMTPEEELNDTVSKLEQALRDAGVKVKRDKGREIYRWLLRFFNPAPDWTDGDAKKFLNMADYACDEDLPAGDDFAESLFYETPRSDSDTQTWWFNNKPHRVIRADSLRRTPKVGQLTGEVVTAGDGKASCMMDRLPPGCMLVITMVITPQSEIDQHLTNLSERSRGDATDAEHTRKACDIATNLIAHKQKLFRASVAVYLRGDDLKDLRTKSNKVASLLLSNHLRPIREEDEVLGLNSYLWNLPMAWDPFYDKSFRAMRPTWSQHATDLMPLFGRERGTGNPGILSFNRGGEPILVDPFNSEDRGQNSHMIITGPTGAGKSVLVNTMAAQMMAMHRPKLFIWELGGSFNLLASYFESLGLTVNRWTLKPGAGVSLAPFAHATRLLQDVSLDSSAEYDAAAKDISEDDIKAYIPDAIVQAGYQGDYRRLSEAQQNEVWKRATVLAVAQTISQNDQAGDDQRDIIGELETIAVLMITGGDKSESERMTRADRRMIRDAIILGAENAVKANVTCRTQHVVDAFKSISKDEDYPEERRHRAFDMSQSMGLFLDGISGELFNSDGEPWPDTDVTIVDAATLGREGYEASLSIAFASMMMHINGLGEKTQMDARKILFCVDEAHLVTQSPILAPFMIKAIKVQRKIGISTWLASQNTADYIGPARKLLNLAEFFVMLVPPKEEIEELSKVRQLTDDQKHLLLSCRKEHRKYTEGAIFGSKMEILFRTVPPSLFLSLASTEKEEKSERMRYMREFGITEVEAAIYIGRLMDHYRGISDMPDRPDGKPHEALTEDKAA